MPFTPAVGVAVGLVRRRSSSVVAAWAVLALASWLAIGAGLASAAPNSLALRATYDVSAQVNWAAGTMSVSSIASVTNTTAEPVDRLAFNLVTLRTGAAQLTDVRVGGEPVAAQASGQTVTVPLAAPLAPGGQVNVRIDYTARFNAYSGQKRELFMKKSNIITAYRWIPWLSREQPFRAPNFGETWATAISPEVRVKLTSAAGLTWATSGRRTDVSGNTQTFVANDVRDFNFSASPGYRTHRVTWNGITLRFYYRSLPRDVLVRHSLDALKRFSGRIGPFPYTRLTVAETPAGSGMESPTLNWISSTLSGSRLRHILVHEVAHQWFYGIVGNNQATSPFIDEAVSDFLTRNMLGTMRASECAQQRLDRSTYDYRGRCYHEVIYVQGALYLRDYRQEVGDDAFWTGLGNFYREKRFEIAGTRALLDALDAASGYDSRRHAARFPSLYE